LRAAGRRVGVIGTVSYRVSGGGAPHAPDFSRAAPLTTPGALAIQALFAEMRDAGASDVVLEASSHALDQGRLEGCRFRVAGLTNLTQDHLDYHGTMDAYFDAKAILFERLLDPRAGVAVLPVDRPEGRAMRARVAGRAGAVLGVAAAPTPGADVVAEQVDASSAGMRLRLGTPLGPLEVVSPLVGTFNLENILLAVGMAIGRGLDADAIVAGIEALPGVPGRLERVENDRGILCVVDYAHTPDALERAIAALRPLVAPGARLMTVFGCGGDRDRTKRPLMGQAAARDSELAIVTSDNPRTEDPATILAMIVDGCRRTGAEELTAAALGGATRGFCVVPDRRAAIRSAVDAVRAGDVLVIAGKGHEDYQIVGPDRLHFDDREEARAAFATAAPPSSRPPGSRT
jgi:UDP-N-acetylmuramoyl-L-alanyl-D-glutamate--2,6-diaminopimelate ligase